ncbi:MAG TPA: BON domain-containing protein [Pyrinomonadaceae bacterium]|jgi:hypothetical protein|nr:BON domain-containing protein [Pyrinomonadaceae bacterium]
MSQDEERQRRSRVVVETPTTRREEYVTQTRHVPGDRGGYSTGVVAAVALTAIALTALLVFFFMNSGTDATQTNVNVTAAATPIPTVPTPIVLQQATPLPQQPIIIQQPPPASQPAPVIVAPPAGATSSAPAPNPANDDTAIESRVNKALNDDATLASLGITVTVIEGKAMLNGLVKTAELKAHAEQIARTVRGVKSVDNKIIVEGQ